MHCQISTSTMSGSSPLVSGRLGGAASGRLTMFLLSKASWMSSLMPRGRIPSLIARDCSVTIHERLLFCRLPQKKLGGDHHFPRGMAAGFRYNSHTEVT